MVMEEMATPRDDVRPGPRPVRQARREGRRPACRPSLPPLPPGRQGRPAGTRPLAGRPRQPADGPRRGQPLLADALRHRPGQDGRGLRRRRASGRATRSCSTGWPPSSSGPAGTSRRCCRLIVTQRDLPPVVAGRRPSCCATRPGEPPAGPRPAVPALGRDDPRPGAGGQRPARRAARRAVGQAVPAGGAVERAGRRRRLRPRTRARTCTAAACTRSGSGPSPPPSMIDVRRPGPRDLHRSARRAPTRRCRRWRC